MIADMPAIGPMWLWALAIAIVIGYLALGPLVHRAPTTPADVSNLDALDGMGDHCDQRVCPGAGRYNVTDNEGHPRRVCATCFATGWRLGWWVSVADREPYDQEASA